MVKKQEIQVKETSTSTKIWVSVFILFGLMFITVLTAATIMLFDGDSAYGANVAIIPIEGTILAGEGSSFGGGVAASSTIVADIAAAEDDANIKAVVFLINSPGGSAVASDEIATAIARMQKPSVAVIREVGASGAYWVASANDHVIANPMSITGSIGVIGSYLSFGKFLEHWNVTYNQVIAGERKDLGTPLRELEPQERAFLQEKLDAIHAYFIQAIATNRNMSVEKVRPLADGRFFLGTEAKDAGLVDALGGEQEALDWINATIKEEPVTVVYEHEQSLIDVLSSLSAQGTLTPEAALQQAAQAASERTVPMAR